MGEDPTNAERQRRYIARLKERAAKAGVVENLPSTGVKALLRILAAMFEANANDAATSASKEIRKLEPGLKEAARHARAMIKELNQ